MTTNDCKNYLEQDRDDMGGAFDCAADCDHSECPKVLSKTDNFVQRDFEAERIQAEKERVENRIRWDSLSEDQKKRIFQHAKDLEDAMFMGSSCHT